MALLNNIVIFFMHVNELLNMSKIKPDFNQQKFKTVDPYLVNLNNFHSLEVGDRVSGTKLQAVKGSTTLDFSVISFGVKLT